MYMCQCKKNALFPLILTILLYSQHFLQIAGLCAWHTVRPNKPKHQSLELRKIYCRVMQGDGWIVSLNAKLLKEFQQSTFKGKVREGHDWLLPSSWYRNPLFLQLSMWVRSWCLCKPPNVIFCSENFYLYMNGPLKVRALRMGYPVCFGQTSFTSGAEPAWLSTGNRTQG